MAMFVGVHSGWYSYQNVFFLAALTVAPLAPYWREIWRPQFFVKVLPALTMAGLYASRYVFTLYESHIKWLIDHGMGGIGWSGE
ncbi:hypothetical protein ACXYUI_28730, partial [Klebsiella pneumoniae]